MLASILSLGVRCCGTIPLADEMNRRRWLGATGAAALCVACLPIHAQAGVAAPIALRSIAVLDVELVDDQNNPLTKAAQEVRLRNATMQLRQELER